MLPKRKSKVDTEDVQHKEVEKKLKFKRTIKPSKGHTLFKVNEKTHEIIEVEFEDDIKTITWEKALKKDFSTKKKVVIEEGFIYISTLNRKNVIKILARDYHIIINQVN